MRKAFLALLACVAGSSVSAQTITLWNFNSNPPDANTATGTTAPATGTGTASLVGGVTGIFASGDASGGSSDPATGDDAGWQISTFPASGASGTAGVRFDVSTVGFSNIRVSLDARTSNTSSRYYELRYTLDGTSFTPFGGPIVAAGGDTWLNGATIDLSSVAGANNNPQFGFEVVSIFSPVGFTQTTAPNTVFGPNEGYRAANADDRAYAGSGTFRVDMVKVEQVPEPGTAALLGCGAAGLALAVRRRQASAMTKATKRF